VEAGIPEPCVTKTITEMAYLHHGLILGLVSDVHKMHQNDVDLQSQDKEIKINLNR
jgi:hypothetical protein